MIKKILQRFFLLAQILTDKIHGCDFAIPMDNQQIQVLLSDGSPYQATSPRLYWTLRKHLKHIHPTDSILDVGCGKGRMLYFFSKFQFGKIDGLEYSELLASIAEKNITKLHLKSNIYTENAATFTSLNYNYFYLFNPFPEKIMKQFVHNLCNNIVTNPRKVTILYFNPVCKECFIENGFELVSFTKGLMVLTK